MDDVFGDCEEVALSEWLWCLAEVNSVVDTGAIRNPIRLRHPAGCGGFAQLANPVHICGQVGIAVAMILEA